jgi:hypothetical protein
MSAVLRLENQLRFNRRSAFAPALHCCCWQLLVPFPCPEGGDGAGAASTSASDFTGFPAAGSIFCSPASLRPGRRCMASLTTPCPCPALRLQSNHHQAALRRSAPALALLPA